MVGIALELKYRGYHIIILSNNFMERAEYYAKNFSFLTEIADKVYYSWQTGFVKPDPRAYQKILEDNNLEPDECIYFDDSEENIRVAGELGIRSFLFDNVDSVRKVFAKMGI